jgi:hypothetical protein
METCRWSGFRDITFLSVCRLPFAFPSGRPSCRAISAAPRATRPLPRRGAWSGMPVEELSGLAGRPVGVQDGQPPGQSSLRTLLRKLHARVPLKGLSNRTSREFDSPWISRCGNSPLFSKLLALGIFTEGYHLAPGLKSAAPRIIFTFRSSLLRK